MSMTVALVLFSLMSLSFSILLTPLVRTWGIKLGAIDIPDDRKIHTRPVPRIGGLAVLLSCVLTFIIAVQYLPPDLYVFNTDKALGYLGALLIFVCGFWDDFRGLKSWTKLFFQIAAATLAFIGGAKISSFSVFSYALHFNLLASYIITVFWFLLFINAVNLIDGLDGLASGLIFFTCTVMAISTYVNDSYLSAFYFAILGGAVLGFLKYNFNPASIFLGDSGSYYLGYMVALMSILGSHKSQVGVLMLIPLLALGVPIFDSILSPIRRFIRGRSMFEPDKGHIHHALLRMGLSSRKAVLILYGISMAFCIVAIFIITFRGRSFLGISLTVLLFGMIFLVRKLGYLEYFAFDKVYGWFQDVTDITGISQHRRSFLALQIDAGEAQTMDELWDETIDALKMLKFDQAQLCIENEPVREWKMADNGDLVFPEETGAIKMDSCVVDNVLKMEIPLYDDENKTVLGKMILTKNLELGNLETYTIRRVESLRRTLINNIRRLKK